MNPRIPPQHLLSRPKRKSASPPTHLQSRQIHFHQHFQAFALFASASTRTLESLPFPVPAAIRLGKTSNESEPIPQQPFQSAKASSSGDPYPGWKLPSDK